MISRWISALAAILVMFGASYFGGVTGLLVLCSLICMVTAAEYSLLFEAPMKWRLPFWFLNAAVFFTQLLRPEYSLAVLVGSFVVLSSMAVFFFRQSEPQQSLAKLQWTLWGVIYTGLFPALSLNILYRLGWVPLIYLLITVFLGDTFAFFVGRWFKGPKIFPKISPQKTCSGAIGGLFGSGIFGTLFLYKFSEMESLILMLVMSLSIGFFAQFGDFFESLLKRVAGKKDSGRWMPGHGGFLDRLDGVYFGSAVLYFFFRLMADTPFF